MTMCSTKDQGSICALCIIYYFDFNLTVLLKKKKMISKEKFGAWKWNDVRKPERNENENKKILK